MWLPHESNLAATLVKAVTPVLSKIACLPGLNQFVRLSNIYLSILHGKGGGGSWQFAAEASSAHTFIKRKNPVIFDLGANRGSWTQDMRNRLEKEYSPRFYLFEPSPECHEIIKSLNLPSAKLFQTAVGEKSGEIPMYVPDAASTVSSIHKRRDSFTRDLKFDEVIVPIVTIDEIIESEQIDFVDFMKMDVEGHELAVLKGAEKSLKSGKIKALSFEFGACNLNSRTFFFDFWDLLASHGYRLLRITPGGTLLDVNEYYEDIEYFRAAANYIAVLNSYEKNPIHSPA